MIREHMRIVHNYDVPNHRERELCTSCHKLIVVGSCSHGIQDKVCWQCLLCLVMQQHCWSSFTFSLDKDNCLKWSH